MEQSARVVIAMDPHKRSVTIWVMAGDETVLGGGRFGTDPDGYGVAEQILAALRPRDAAGKIRRRVAAELVGDLERTYRRKKAADKELTEVVRAAAGFYARSWRVREVTDPRSARTRRRLAPCRPGAQDGLPTKRPRVGVWSRGAGLPDSPARR